MKSSALCVSTLLLTWSCVSAGGTEEKKGKTSPPNVLLICIDDLRPELGCYGAEHVQSPALDAFASTALRFDRQYVAFPTCGASRFAFLTGRRPTEAKHYGNGAFQTLRGTQPESKPDLQSSMPRAFRSAGYRTVCLGKISHSHDGLNQEGEQELPDAWDATPTDPGVWGETRHLLHGYSGGRARIPGESSIFEEADVADDQYPDAQLASQAIYQLELLATADQPFFLGVGFFKPHLPFAAPKKYWDLYNRDALPLAADNERPEELPKQNGWVQSGEVTGNYSGAGYEDKYWSEKERRHLRHGYFACVSFVDAQVGRVLLKLRELKLDQNTIIVVWGDHGWHLGDQGLFGKHTTFEVALRSALMIRVPQMSTGGQNTKALVESIDIYPTLAELCGLPFPKELPGRSFNSLFAAPQTAHRESALSFWRRGKWLAESVRTESTRRVSWTHGEDGRSGGDEVYVFEP